MSNARKPKEFTPEEAERFVQQPSAGTGAARTVTVKVMNVSSTEVEGQRKAAQNFRPVPVPPSPSVLDRCKTLYRSMSDDDKKLFVWWMAHGMPESTASTAEDVVSQPATWESKINDLLSRPRPTLQAAAAIEKTDE